MCSSHQLWHTRHALLISAALSTHSKGLFTPEWAEEPCSSVRRDLLLIQVTLLSLLQEQGILWGPHVAQYPHSGTSKHHCCPGQQRKTSPLLATVSSSVDGFKRTHCLTHCPHNASDLKQPCPLPPLFSWPSARMWLQFLLQLQLSCTPNFTACANYLVLGCN